MSLNLRDDFPFFKNSDIAYLDSAATTQKPYSVIKEIEDYYTKYNANAGRGSHELSMLSKQLISDTRKKIKEFVGASSDEEVIFTKNTTEAINLIAYSYALNNLKENDEILLGISNHHSNIVPWQFVSSKTGAKIKYIYLDENGQLDINDFKSKLSNKTKLVSISAVVNTTGVIQPFYEIIKLSHLVNAITLIDTAQSILHFKHEFSKWDMDIITFSGHKMYASLGIGVLVAKRKLLENIPPFIYGGDMIEYVEEESSTFKDLPERFEAGTLDTSAILSLNKAIDYINDVSYDKIREIEYNLSSLLIDKLKKLDFIELYCVDVVDRVGIVSFNVKGVHSHDTAFILDQYKVAIRSGHHCTQPLMKYLGIASSCRVSISIYNNVEDIDRLILALYKVKEVFYG